MKNNFNLIIFVAGFISAIFLSSFIKFGITFSFFLIFLSIILFFYSKFLISDIGNLNQGESLVRSKKQIFLISIFILSFALGIFMYELKDSQNLDNNLESNLNEKVFIEGIVSDEPNKKDNRVILSVDFKNIVASSSKIAVSGKGLISTDIYPEIKYGDLIKINGKLEKPGNFINKSASSSFDYISYLAKDDIFYKIDFAKTEIISNNNGNKIKQFLFNIKNSFIKNINKTISEPESSLLSGILLGSKNSIDKNTTEIFRKAGLSHIVALSGYNITIVADAIMETFSFLPRNISFLGGILGIIIFVIMTGASSTAVRSGIMALIVILASITHRNYQAGRALIIAGFLMIIINPKILVFDTSFQLSFLATIAVIYVSPILKDRFSFIPEKFKLRETISSTVAAQILVLPLILNKMGNLSLVALPTNILVLGIIPATMFFGFITGLLGFFWLPIFNPFAWISWMLLSYIIKISTIFSELPFSSLNINWFSNILMIVCYIIIFVWILINNKKQNV